MCSFDDLDDPTQDVGKTITQGVVNLRGVHLVISKEQRVIEVSTVKPVGAGLLATHRHRGQALM
ncbi:hypothetical protein, partial [Pseudomonas marginalis]|uniref:hypothetical protein n=1 Tax=Pseudomonas marginalis TaxID=298 RepID=UPI001C833D32